MIDGRATGGNGDVGSHPLRSLPLHRHRSGPLVTSSTAPGRPAALHPGVRVRSTLLDMGPGMEQPCAGHRSGTSSRRQHLLPGSGRAVLRADRLQRAGPLRTRVSALRCCGWPTRTMRSSLRVAVSRLSSAGLLPAARSRGHAPRPPRPHTTARRHLARPDSRGPRRPAEFRYPTAGEIALTFKDWPAGRSVPHAQALFLAP
jgi:hypothetical protein